MDLISILLNPAYILAIIFGFIIYNFYHIYLIERFLQKYKLSLGFFDKLFLFRIPVWKPIFKLNDSELKVARSMAKQYVFTNTIWILLYIGSYTLTLNAI